MNILKGPFRIPLLLISLWMAACGAAPQKPRGSFQFADPREHRVTSPVYPGATPDLGYAAIMKHIIAYVYGLDPRFIAVEAYYTQDPIGKVQEFYASTFGYAFVNETDEHEAFMKRYSRLFRETYFFEPGGAFTHGMSTKMDLYCPVYNYALQSWQPGTMIVFRP